MVQHLIVAVIVTAAALYAAWRWMPAAWRRGAARRLAQGSQRAGLADARQAERMASRLSRTSGCGSCDSCGDCAAPVGGTGREGQDLRRR